MNTIKKLIIALSAVMLFALVSNQGAYASELQEQLILTEESNPVDITYSLEAEDATNPLTLDLTDAKETEDLETEELENLNLEDLDADDIDLFNIDLEELDLEELDLENIDLEDLGLDLDKYEIVFDEQGQAYLEKKAEILELEEKEKQSKEKEKAVEKKKKPKYSEKELRLLASLVYAEAGNQSYDGMLAVANVVLNRAKSKAYSHVNTVHQVIYDKKWAVQFTVTVVNKKTGKSMLDRALELYDTGKINGKNSKSERKAMERDIEAAKAALEGENNIGDYLCFRVNNKGASSIKKKYKYKVIGDHIFYRTK